MEQTTLKCLIYPDNKFYAFWDLFMTVVLLFSCIITPIHLALFEELNETWTAINWSIDAFFFVDILVNFNAATYDDDFELIDDRCAIAKNYLNSWFLIDLVAIIPFELMFPNNGEAGNLVRISRIGRLQKFGRLVRLFRLFKIAKNSSSEFFEGII